MNELSDLHIIIAEDDADDGDFVQKSFVKHAAFSKVDWVKNGRELLELLRNSKGKMPDVILTDINMPIMNGIEALDLIFHDPGLCGIPCFVYSSTVNPAYERKCKELGIRGFLIKPFNLLEYDDLPYQIIYILNQRMAVKT
jgi:CheY-like chemotaxis protein